MIPTKKNTTNQFLVNSFERPSSHILIVGVFLRWVSMMDIKRAMEFIVSANGTFTSKFTYAVSSFILTSLKNIFVVTLFADVFFIPVEVQRI